jgi:hypothetical protein
VAGDEVYGNSRALRAELEARGVGYVLAVACDHRVVAGRDTYRADALAARLPARAWQQVSCGKGAKATACTTGRSCAWTTTALYLPARPAGTGCWSAAPAHRRVGLLPLLHPPPHPAGRPGPVAGRRWTVEEAFQAGKGLCGLDQHQIRRWRSWYRWATLAMLAHAFLVVTALAERTQRPPPSALLPMTCNELQRLFAALLAQPVGDRGHRLRWSVWRRRHQARARTCHYRWQAADL